MAKGEEPRVFKSIKYISAFTSNIQISPDIGEQESSLEKRDLWGVWNRIHQTSPGNGNIGRGLGEMF